MVRYLFAAVALSAMVVSAQTQAGQQFDVASIKRNTSNEFGKFIPPGIRPGQFSVINSTLREIISFGYPVQTAPAQVFGLPEWAESEHYDVLATLKGTPTADALQQMWRAFLSDRLKLQAHYETRERASYDLVFARDDRRLGPQLQPSTVDCTTPPAAVAGSANQLEGRIRMLMQRCALGMIPSGQSLGLYSGGTSVAALARALTVHARRPITDRTGLTGNYAISLQFAIDAAPPQPDSAIDDAPRLFTALREQLGLKLEPSTMQGQVLVIDQIERPSEN
jgi:bla regulator protein BlaR1